MATLPGGSGSFAAGQAILYRISAFNPAGTSVPSPEAGVFPPGFAGWRLLHGIAGEMANTDDADGDGIPLYLEYALDLSPVTASRTGLPTMILSGNLIEFHFSGPRSDVEYLVESSENLLNWTTDEVTQGPAVTNRVATANRSGFQRRFLRLSVRPVTN